jgi:hypothetical protein
MFSSTSLKSLTITSTQNDEDVPGEFQYLVIDMPNLVSLRLEEIPRRTIHLVDVSSVRTASIYLFFHTLSRTLRFPAVIWNLRPHLMASSNMFQIS